MSKPYVHDQNGAKVLGCLFIAAGAFLLYDAYERRGQSRPFALKFLPG